MTNLVSLPKLNELRHPLDPRPLTTLRTLAQGGRLPGAVQISGPGSAWMVDLDTYDAAIQAQLGTLPVSANSSTATLDQHADAIMSRLDRGFRKAS